MLAYTTGRVVVTPAASARSNARALERHLARRRDAERF